MASTLQSPARSLSDLVPLMRQAPGFAGVLAALMRGDSAAIDGAWGSSCALAGAVLAGGGAAHEAPHAVLFVLPRISEVDDFAADLTEFGGAAPLIFPAWEAAPRERRAADPIFNARLRVVRQLVDAVSAPVRQIIATSLPALLSPVPDFAELQSATRPVQVGDRLDPEELMRWLIERGFERVAAIEAPGEFTMHGGILDVFPTGDEAPLRIEFFGDEIESIRRFNAETQRKVADLNAVQICAVAATSSAAGAAPRNGQAMPGAAHLVDLLPPGSWIVLGELDELRDEGRHYLERLDNPRGMYSVEATLEACVRFPTATIAALSGDSFETSCHLQIESIERFQAPAAAVVGELAKVVGRDERVLIACHNEGERQRLGELLADTELYNSDRVELCVGRLTRGFRMVAARLIVLSDNELFSRREVRRATGKQARIESRAIDSFLELNSGDLVVHLTKGIARYRGMELLKDGEHEEEHLRLEFRDAVKVFVPVSLIHLVQKYVGAANTSPTLSRIGTNSWEKRKQATASAVADLACEMIRLQAERAAKPGLAFPADSHWQQEFEASFPYTETEDQLSSIAAIKEDMQRPRPMDRLICGDVGYGKTEVAIRGAFKALDAGKQVAVLVPTTVLAEQHYRTFTERMAEYPFLIDVLSRFKTKAEQRGILEGLAAGRLDLVIGTHRLIQPDVRFSDLGLLIIDEEQRFGVEAKEMLKRLRLEVDVLTLSATPIPRTLHLSLLGIRDISNLQTPPHDRLAIETRISRFDAELIRRGIVRELNRGGQVYFVHNRVYDIRSFADRIQTIVPEARIGIVHGQMGEHALEDEMVAFVNGQTDVLVATTIIESGLDIPNANTIFIHQADQYGLADLHQLRGRVGRYRHRAYCYLLLEEGRSLTSVAARRLKAIEEFSDLGAGFKIAMRDLEIRGAGNILGTEQSGHIASVGYELYCQLLENAVRRLKNQPLRETRHVAIDLPLAAYLPGSYVPPGRHKIEMYRRLSRVDTLEQLGELLVEFTDRFGPPPEPVLNLFEIKELQLLARAWQIDGVHLEDGFAVFRYRQRGLIERLVRLSAHPLRIVDASSAYLALPPGAHSARQLLDLIKPLLQSKPV